jgi:hypothetical protein
MVGGQHSKASGVTPSSQQSFLSQNATIVEGQGIPHHIFNEEEPHRSGNFSSNEHQQRPVHNSYLAQAHARAQVEAEVRRNNGAQESISISVPPGSVQSNNRADNYALSES